MRNLTPLRKKQSPTVPENIQAFPPKPFKLAANIPVFPQKPFKLHENIQVSPRTSFKLPEHIQALFP